MDGGAVNSGGLSGGGDGSARGEGGNDLGLNRRQCRILSNRVLHKKSAAGRKGRVALSPI